MKSNLKVPTTVGIRELKQRLGYYFSQAERGHSIRITRRGKVVLTVSAPPPRDETLDPDLERRLEELERQGVLRRGIGEPIGLHPRVKLRGKPVSQTVIEDRR